MLFSHKICFHEQLFAKKKQRNIKPCILKVNINAQQYAYLFKRKEYLTVENFKTNTFLIKFINGCLIKS